MAVVLKKGFSAFILIYPIVIISPGYQMDYSSEYVNDYPIQEVLVEKVNAHHSLKADSGKVALQQGPFVHSFESIDNDDQVVNDALNTGEYINTEFSANPLVGIAAITGAALQDGQPQQVTYAWAHRGDNKMAVWPDAYKND